MLGDSAVLGGGGDAAATPNMTAEAAVAGGGVGSNSESDVERSRIDEGERSFGGNRWPRQETMALLRIRSDMDTTFRDASVKGPLWDEVSRKLAELGYHRSAKKCKEKFENVYKYHKRTKDGRGGKSDGKTYRFFDQLEALDHFHNPPSNHPQPQNQPQISAPTIAPPQVVTTTATISIPIAEPATIPMSLRPVVNTTLSIPNASVPLIPMPQNNIVTTQSIMNMNQTIPSNPSTNFQPSTINPATIASLPSFPNISTDLFSNSMASSYSTSSDDTMEEGSRKRKRKWTNFFERLMKEVIEKQEDLHKRFLEAIEKREQDRMAREEAWREQEMQRINREREILAQERSVSAAKDAAIMSFLQKIAEQQNLGQALNIINIAQPPPPPQQQPQKQRSAAAAATTPLPPAPTPISVVQQVQAHPPPSSKPAPPTAPQQQQQSVTNMEIVKVDNNGENFMGVSPSRWPKVEVQALINLRTSMDNKYQENVPKGPLWEEISSAMKNLGYNRNAKRCKEKWENINKYFKKVKESNKKRPEDSKTCPYFHQLDALYKEKGKGDNSGGSGGSSQVVKPDNMTAPLMVRPEQQWPPQQEEDRMNRDRGEEEDDMDEDDKEGEDENEQDMDESGGCGGGGSNFEVVAASKPTVDASA
ncbi:unnamed protein product [Trifolium pratense]|uniref:Uncharacterized protein n=1 Tax=Trifolium pratense TaxID=57577 RepID=A0ACB0IC67_TRIPR|nr:unnamed protein product [Trifolium pratense]